MKRRRDRTSPSKPVLTRHPAKVTELNTYFEGNDKKVLERPRSGDDSPRSPGPHRGSALADRGPGELGASPILDPYTPKSELENTDQIQHVKAFFQSRRTKQQRRVYSRIYWGLQLPGRHAFLTLTNCGKGDQQLENWQKIKWWLKRHYPGISGIRVFTDEGNGVIHAVIRQGMKQKRIDKLELDLYLCESLGCGFSAIKRVRESGKAGLAAYLSDQRAKRGMSKEMAHQTLMTKYNYLGEWLPRGWLAQFGRAWFRTNGMFLGERLEYFKRWILNYRKDPFCLSPSVPVTWDHDVGWVDMLPEELDLL